MHRRELLRASVLLPLASSTSAPTARAAPSAATLHVTFLYHCAFAGWDDGRRTDVFLSPGSADPTHHGSPAHVASLRVPAGCVLDDSQHPGTNDQGDRVWRLEGYDLSVALDESRGRTTRSWQVALDGAPSSTPGAPGVFTLANLDGLIGKPSFDTSCLADDPPAFLRAGGRVRLNGGHVGCGLPTTQSLREIVWDLGDGAPTGLSDRVDYLKPTSGPVVMEFRRFGERTSRRVTLQADGSGVARAFVSNDPVIAGIGRGEACPSLPHFALYYLLAQPAGVPKSHRVPTVHSRAALLSQGNSFCCPCSGWP